MGGTAARECDRPETQDSGTLPRARAARSWPVGILLALLLGSPAAAQEEAGRWSWEGFAGLGQRRIENSAAGAPTSRSDQYELILGGAGRGYLGHPAIGNFRAGLELIHSQVRSGGDRQSNRLGFDLGVNILPRGPVPVRLWARRLWWGYDLDGPQSAPLSWRAPDLGEVWGGQFRVRRGAFRGVFVSAVRNTTEFVDGYADTNDRQIVDFSRAARRSTHAVKLEHRAQEFGYSDFGFSRWTLNADERFELGRGWRWQLIGIGVHHMGRSGDVEFLAENSVRMRNLVTRHYADGDQLQLEVSNFGIDREANPRLRGDDLSATYRFRVGRHWFLSPFAAFTTQRAENLEIDAPGVGITATWNRSWQAWSVLASARTRHSRLDLSNLGGSQDERRTAYGVDGSIRHGDPEGLQKELEFQWSRDQLRRELESFDLVPAEDDPALSQPLLLTGGIGLDEIRRLRFRLNHRWDSRAVSGWLEWRQQSRDGDALGPGYRFDTLAAIAQFNTAKFDFHGNIGTTAMDNSVAGDQSVRFVGVRGTWSPKRYLRVWVSARADRRDLEFLPDIDGVQLETGMLLQVGLLDVRVAVTDYTDHLADGNDQGRRAYTWRVGRRFAGWLPVFTGTKRRGVIR